MVKIEKPHLSNTTVIIVALRLRGYLLAACPNRSQNCRKSENDYTVPKTWWNMGRSAHSNLVR